ncbi:MAG: hypothetical protein NDJ90_11780 [Oligoflexia bacterium]|nr:hypothetical protein [Oligoflexia bacterium]
MVGLLSNPKKLDAIEKTIDKNLEKLFANPAFLQSISMMLNANSYRKILVNFALTQIWKSLQLPNKRDQERTLHLIHELNHRIDTLKEEIDHLTAEADAERERPAPIRRVQRRAKAEAVETAREALAVQ